MAKRCLKTGVFGKDENGDLFIVVDKYLSYQDGLKDLVDDLNNDLEFKSGGKIVALYKASCFNEVKRGEGKVIWERENKPT